MTLSRRRVSSRTPGRPALRTRAARAARLDGQHSPERRHGSQSGTRGLNPGATSTQKEALTVARLPQARATAASGPAMVSRPARAPGLRAAEAAANDWVLRWRRTSSLAATRRRLVAFQLGSDVVGVVAAVDADALAPRAWKHGGRGRRAFPARTGALVGAGGMHAASSARVFVRLRGWTSTHWWGFERRLLR